MFAEISSSLQHSLTMLELNVEFVQCQVAASSPGKEVPMPARPLPWAAACFALRGSLLLFAPCRRLRSRAGLSQIQIHGLQQSATQSQI